MHVADGDIPVVHGTDRVSLIGPGCCCAEKAIRQRLTLNLRARLFSVRTH